VRTTGFILTLARTSDAVHDENYLTVLSHKGRALVLFRKIFFNEPEDGFEQGLAWIVIFVDQG